ncbi:hypothetical protein F511_08376 [Dorcoceras hygrometricum]|uniref:Uncharacterized protein n=1 Tax=Dorcoceras hygrometricum TaxID=472368 RepID=A0A2Z7DGM7_9LAMI|nr:hypothetical protein F511_08376 [Dorcoceras hygrometricum]
MEMSALPDPELFTRQAMRWALILTKITPRLMSILSEIVSVIPDDLVVQIEISVYWLDSWRHDPLIGKLSRTVRKSSGNPPELST